MNVKSTIKMSSKKNNYPWITAPQHYIWNEEAAEDFGRALTSSTLSGIAELCSQYLDAGLVGMASLKLNELFSKAAESTLKIKAKSPKGKEKHPFKHKVKPKKWYDNECRTLRNTSRKFAVLRQQEPNNFTIRRQYSNALKEYKKVCATKKAILEQSQI